MLLFKLNPPIKASAPFIFSLVLLNGVILKTVFLSEFSTAPPPIKYPFAANSFSDPVLFKVNSEEAKSLILSPAKYFFPFTAK